MPPYIVKIHLAPHYGNDYAAPAKQPSLIINYKIITPFPFWGRAPAGLLTRAASLRSVNKLIEFLNDEWSGSSVLEECLL
jgi:hypothetical protein